jgi:hypothetical protein
LKKLKIKRIIKSEIMNQLDYLIKQDDQLSQSIPECENINRDGENNEN